MYAIKFTPRGEKDIKKLSPNIRKRIHDKLLVYALGKFSISGIKSKNK